jgi:hypothetical protein
MGYADRHGGSRPIRRVPGPAEKGGIERRGTEVARLSNLVSRATHGG